MGLKNNIVLEAKDQFDVHDIRAILLNLHAFFADFNFLPIEWGEVQRSRLDVLSHLHRDKNG